MSVTKVYSGSGLDFEDSFRLIEVQAGQNDDIIFVRLIKYRLGDSPPFEALSYVWGDPNLVVPIKVIVSEFEEEFPELSITINCYAAIKRLRRPDAPRTLWIDAISINQHLIPERNHQLGLISHIYGRATRVIVYLGESADDSDAAMDWIRDIDRPDDFDQPARYDEEVKAIKPNTNIIQKLLNRRWFKRIWVLQEIRFARNAVVVCGANEIDWASFKAFNHWNSNEKWVQRLPYVVQWSVVKIDISYSKDLFLSPYPKRLLKKLKQTRNIEATDPRDKLFAILPLLDWEEQRFKVEKMKQTEDAGNSERDYDSENEGSSRNHEDNAAEDYPEYEEDGRQNRCGVIIKEDYSIPTAQIFTSLAQNLIDALGLELIREVVNPTSVPGMPSWAPDWSIDLAYPFVGRSRRANRDLYHSGHLGDIVWNKENMKRPSQTWFFSNYTPDTDGETPDTQLHVHAYPLGTITKLGDMADIYANRLPLACWESLIKDDLPDLLATTALPYPGPEATHNEKHQWDVESLPPFVRALAGDRVIYPYAIREAVKRIKDYTGDEPASEVDKVYWYDDWREAASEDKNGTKIDEKTKNAAKEKPRMPLKDILKSMGVSYESQAEAIFYNCHGRRFFVTNTGRIGFAPETAEVGDLVVAIESSDALFVVRPLEELEDDVKIVRLVRECFVHGLRAESVWKKSLFAESATEMIIR